MNLEKKKKIGGEFEIELANLNNFEYTKEDYENILFSNGRSALKYLLQFLKKNKRTTIHLPYYICPSVVLACKSEGYKVKFYELDKNFMFPIEYVEKIEYNEILLTVNYFGFVNDNIVVTQVKEVREDITIISDQVQSYWTLRNSEADFSFTSLRKHFSLPDGALIYSKNHSLSNPDLHENLFFYSKLLGGILKSQKLPDDLYLYFFKKGEKIIDNSNNITKASLLSHYLFDNLDFNQISTRRKENYKFIYESNLKNEVEFVFDYRRDIIPMNVPVKVKNRNNILEKLKDHGIFLPVHWNLGDYNNSSVISKEMSKNEISLIIDQRYTKLDMELQVEKILNIIKK